MQRAFILAFAVFVPSTHSASPAASGRALFEGPRLCAEWEPSYGTLIRWPLGIPPALVVELAEDDSLYVLVETPAQQSQAEDAFQSWGVNLGHCRFVTAQTWSHWTRDWGPYSMFDGNGVWGITDPVFDGYPWIPGGPYREYGESRGYEEDDQVNAVLAEEFACPLHPFPAYLTGGNFMCDGHGYAFSTLAMLSENEAFWSHGQFLALAGEELGLSSYFITVNPEEFGIQHIDCCAKLLVEETILLKQVPSWHPDYARLETIEDQLTTAISCYGRPYEIVRIQCDPYSGSDVAAYTNSYILNDKVLVPLFGIPSDAAALETYTEAMPGYEVIGFQSGSWYYYDALHCRTREIMDRFMLLLWHRPLDDEMPCLPEYGIDAEVIAYSGEALAPDSLKVVWRTGAGEWQESPMVQSGPDSISGAIPGQPPGTVIDYYIVAADYSGRRETSPRSAPGGFHSFQVAATGTGRSHDDSPLSIRIAPCPSSTLVEFAVTSCTSGGLDLSVFDMAGRLVHHQGLPVAEPGESVFQWAPEAGFPSGCYMAIVRNGSSSACGRVLLVR
ncbi:agmatine deiminase family protein [Candidatus Fermentibacteria bacterium]|nr:agmatine deiminase family protein [Candidatus Fermentibacteria bacterium]